MKRTKIVCTIGPASESRIMISKMVKAGLNVARLNFSHNTYHHHSTLIENIRAVSKRLKQPIAIMQDLQGPRIRIGKLQPNGIQVTEGLKVVLVPEGESIAIKPGEVMIPMQYPKLYADLKPKDPILIDDALIQLTVESIKDRLIHCRVITNGIIKSHKGMNFPKSDISSPAVTAKDLRDVEFGIKKNVDFVSLSFVKKASDITNLRNYIFKLEKKYKLFKKGMPTVRTHIVAKIERREAVKDFDDILRVADGIMIARGDLGIEMPLEDIPLIQKKIIKKCNAAGKPVIVATQMLDSMVRNPVPTRAEVSDIANAILDGADAIMLSGETATGLYPLKAVQVMSRVAHEVEDTEIKEQREFRPKIKRGDQISEAVSRAVLEIAEDVHARLIVCATTSGFTARTIVKYKPAIPVVAVTASEKTQRQLCLSWGTSVFEMPFVSSVSVLINHVTALAKKNLSVKTGDKIVVCAGHPFGYSRETNLVKVFKI